MATQRSAEAFYRFLKRWWPFLIPAAAAFWTITTAVVTGWWTVHQGKLDYEKFSEQLRSEGDKFSASLRLEYDKISTQLEEAQKARDEAHQEADLVRRIQAQQPFLQKQLDLYFEAIQVVGKLTNPALRKDDPEWEKNVTRFWQLRWAELEMVGDAGIRQAMRRVQQQIIEIEFDQNRDRHDLRWSVECLADELRLSLEHAWHIKRDPARITAAGRTASKLPNGCSSGDVGIETLPGMLPLSAPGNWER